MSSHVSGTTFLITRQYRKVSVTLFLIHIARSDHSKRFQITENGHCAPLTCAGNKAHGSFLVKVQLALHCFLPRSCLLTRQQELNLGRLGSEPILPTTSLPPRPTFGKVKNEKYVHQGLLLLFSPGSLTICNCQWEAS